MNFFGGCPNDSRISLDTPLLHYSEITCKASFHHTPAHIRKALDFVSRGRDHRAGFRESRGAAHQSARSDAAPDEPQRSHEDRDHTLVPGSVLAPKEFVYSPEALSDTYTKPAAEAVHALARDASLREFPRRQLPAAQAPAPGFL